MPTVEVLRTEKSWVQKTPGVCGGTACIRNTRHNVWGLVEWRRLGLTDEEILERFEGLTQEDLNAAWAYYEQHPDEIDFLIKLNQEA